MKKHSRPKRYHEPAQPLRVEPRAVSDVPDFICEHCGALTIRRYAGQRFCKRPGCQRAEEMIMGAQVRFSYTRMLIHFSEASS